MPKILADATKARASAIRLKGIEFADQLSRALLDHASEMEKLYMEFQKATKAEKNDLKSYAPLLSTWDMKSSWFEKAQARKQNC